MKLKGDEHFMIDPAPHGARLTATESPVPQKEVLLQPRCNADRGILIVLGLRPF